MSSEKSLSSLGWHSCEELLQSIVQDCDKIINEHLVAMCQ